MPASPPEPKAWPEPQQTCQPLAFLTSASFHHLSLFFTFASTHQKMADVVIVLVTGVLVLLFFRIDLGPRNEHGPRFDPSVGIRDGVLVVDAVRGDPGKA